MADEFDDAPGLSVGDKVIYVPARHHGAARCRLTGKYPWAIGKVVLRTIDGENAEIVQEVRGRDIDLLIEKINKRQPGVKIESLMRLLRPIEGWPATVCGVNGDGTLNIDVQSNQGGVTIHENGVPASDALTEHTCFRHDGTHADHLGKIDLDKLRAARKGA